MPPGALGKDRVMLHAWTPDYPRAAALAEQEGDRFLLTVAGILGDHPPTDPKGFDEFTTSLRFPDVHEAIRDSVPLDDRRYGLRHGTVTRLLAAPTSLLMQR
jgi:hypothetical protein